MLDQKDLIKKVKNYNKFLNPETLSKAYTFALNAHKDQKRDSGDPYLMHPVAVASILTDLKLDSATIATGLLHDTIEDTKTTYKTVEKEFGKEVADLVDGVTKISEIEGKIVENSKAENIRKLILATSKCEGYVGGIKEIPITSAPNCFNQAVNQDPLKPVCPVTKTVFLLSKEIE